MEEHQKQTVLDLPKVIAVGIASPIATLLTSRFGIAGTLIGLALSAVIITVMVDVLKVYLARASHTAVAKVPSSFRAAPLFQPNVRGGLKVVFYRFYSLPPQRRRSILRGGALAAGISFVVGLGVVTALELSAGKSLTCWVWKECPVQSSSNNIEGNQSSTNGGATTKTLDMSTVPSIFGGSPSASSGDALEVRPFDPQQQPTPQQQPASPSGAPESSGTIKSPSSLQPPSSETPGGLGSSSPGAGDQRKAESPPREEDQQSSSHLYYSEEDQESPSYYSYSEKDQYQRPDEEYQQRSTPDPTKEAAQPDTTESREEQPNGGDGSSRHRS